MSEVIEQRQVGDLRVHVLYDEGAAGPRVDYDNLSVMALAHKRYKLANETDLNLGEAGSWSGEFKALQAMVPDLYMAITVSLFDHGIVGLTAGGVIDGPVVNHRDWDSGLVGFCFITNEALDSGWNFDSDEEKKAKALEILKSDVEEYGRYLNGDAFMIEILDTDNSVVTRLGSFYNSTEALEAGVEEAGDGHSKLCNGDLDRHSGLIAHERDCAVHGPVVAPVTANN